MSLVIRFPRDIPQDTAVPGWAYADVPSSGTFDINQALQDNCTFQMSITKQCIDSSPVSARINRNVRAANKLRDSHRDQHGQLIRWC